VDGESKEVDSLDQKKQFRHSIKKPTNAVAQTTNALAQKSPKVVDNKVQSFPFGERAQRFVLANVEPDPLPGCDENEDSTDEKYYVKYPNLGRVDGQHVQHASRFMTSSVSLDAVDDIVFNDDYSPLTNAVWQEATLAQRKAMKKVRNTTNIKG
jgi:hypothetical protein